MNDFEGTERWTLTHQGKVQLNYIYDLFEKGFEIEQIADIMKTKVWCIQLLFSLDSSKEQNEVN